jgi:hypothetical protein
MKVGSIVECIDDANWWEDILLYFDTLPIKGQYYTVRAIIPNHAHIDGPPGIALEEIYGRDAMIKTYTGSSVKIEVHFKIKRFKEVLPPLEDSAIEEMFKQLDNVNLIFPSS